MLKLIKPKTQHLSDEKLMQAIQNGVCEAFNELYKRYNERIYYYFFRMLTNEHQVAEDFTQDLFLKLIQKPEYYDHQRSFSTWVFSIAHNMCKNEYRSRQVRSIVSHEENPDKFFHEEKQKDEKAKNIDLIFSELSKMDESHKTAFLLKYREGFTIDEICEIMDLPQGTVKSRLFYTRKKLQKQLNQTSTF